MRHDRPTTICNNGLDEGMLQGATMQPMKRSRPKFEKLSPAQFEALFGSTTEFANNIGAPVATVGAWKLRGKIPAERVPEVAQATGIPPHRIRPDLYPAPELQGAA
jgi:DNA-binding transcriptional regulator YdaS (Cro superfamily)